MAKDIIGREIDVDDFVYFYNYMYKVISVNPMSVKVIIQPKSPTSKPRVVLGRECALLPKGDVLLWLLKKETKND